MPPKKILAIKLRALGDTVLMTAPLMELRRLFPDAELHVLTDARWAPLLENFPGIRKVWPWHRAATRWERVHSSALVAFRLRQQHFDAVVNFHASPSSAMIARATGARVRSIHFHGHQDTNRYSTVQIPGKGTLKPAIERDMDAVRALTHGVTIPEGSYPVVFLSDQEKSNGLHFLRNELKLSGPILAIAPGSSRPAKGWPLENFSTLAQLWCEHQQGSVIAVAGNGEEHLLAEITRSTDSERIAVRAGMPLRQLASVLSHCSVLVGSDSGPRHLAVAVNTPTVTLFGPEDPFEWHPYRTDMHPRFFIQNLPCRRDAHPGMPAWCGAEICPLPPGEGWHQCMKGIAVRDVFPECQRVARTASEDRSPCPYL